MNQKGTVGSAVPSFSDVRDRVGHDRPPYATRVIGQEVWKVEVLLTATGVSIGYLKRRKRALLGFAMGYVKDDDPTMEWGLERNDGSASLKSYDSFSKIWHFKELQEPLRNVCLLISLDLIIIALPVSLR